MPAGSEGTGKNGAIPEPAVFVSTKRNGVAKLLDVPTSVAKLGVFFHYCVGL